MSASNNHSHESHDHQHGQACGHTAVRHGDHVDYLHEGHLHHAKGQGIGECRISTDAANPAQCTPQHACSDHAKDHQHGAKCGHEAVPHGDHVDYLVAGHLHHPHGPHCDDHGALRVMA